jgi:hypothetical protein
MSETQTPPEGDDGKVELLLRNSLRRTGLDSAALARMRSTVEAEWRAGLAAPPQTRSARMMHARWWGAAAAAMAASALLISWLLLQPAVVFGVIQSPSPEGQQISRIGHTDARISVDPVLRVGEHIQAQSNVLLRLGSGALMRLKSGSALDLTSPAEVRLTQGAVYVDADPREGRSPLRVLTPAGIVEHLGTQYEVALLDDQVRVRVREGAVRLGDLLKIEAGEELTRKANGAVQRRELPAYDSEWAWVQSPVAGLDIEGRNLEFLLRWVARETGRRLEFADAQVSRLATNTVLHGSIAGLGPELALHAMLATTSVQVDMGIDRILVRSGSGPLPN